MIVRGMANRIIPPTKKDEYRRLSNFKCIYHKATRAALNTVNVKSTGTLKAVKLAATNSITVSTPRTTAIPAYWRQPGDV
jgi:hypothetical protein